MTEEAKRQALEKVKTMLDENERVRVVEARSLETVYEGPHTRATREGRQRYLLIAVGEELDTEKMAVRLLSSALVSRG